MSRVLKPLLLVSISFVAGLGAAYFYLASPRTKHSTAASMVRVQQGQVGMINPLLECEGVEFQETPSFMSSIRDLSTKQKSLTRYALYFRDLNNGPWFGINEREEFIGASLMKVGLLISFLKATELKPFVLEEKLKLLPEDLELTKFQQIGNFSDLSANVPYKVEELLARVIIESDNRPLNTLVRSGLAPTLDEVMKHLGVSYKLVPDLGASISVKSYASLFRILYNASYLTSARSHQALELLSRSSFRDGIVAGLPSNIIVAHKFGERAITEDQSQLHDCGIAYVPERPYLLCIMTQGKDVNELRDFIREVSRITYSAVTSRGLPLAKVSE